MKYVRGTNMEQLSGNFGLGKYFQESMEVQVSYINSF